MMDTDRELPRDLALGSFAPRRIDDGIELRYGGIRWFRVLTIVRFVGLAAAVITPLCFIHHQDAMELALLSWIGVIVAIFAGFGANLRHGAYRTGQYLRVEELLAIRRPGARGGYRASGSEPVRIEVDGRLVSDAMPSRVVLSQALVVMTMNGITTTKKLYHVSLVFRALVVRVARFAEKADEARHFGQALAEALELPRPGKRCEEASFENSMVGKYGFAFSAVGEMFAFPVLGAMIAQAALLGPAVVRAEVALLLWIGLHFAVDREMRRRGQRQLASIAIVAFDIEPSAEPAPGAEVL